MCAVWWRSRFIQLRATPAIDAIDGLTLADVPVSEGPCVTLAPKDGAAVILDAVSATSRQEVFPVLDSQGALVGIITLDELTALAAEPDAGDIVCATDIMRAPLSFQRKTSSRAPSR